MLKLLAVALCTGLTMPLMVAELIFKLGKDRARYIYRVLFVVPMVVPVIVTLLIWQFIYDPDLGVLNHLLAAVGLGGLRQAWLSDPRLALWSLAAIGFPWVGGFALLIYYAGLQNISTSVFEAAQDSTAQGAVAILVYRSSAAFRADQAARYPDIYRRHSGVPELPHRHAGRARLCHDGSGAAPLPERDNVR